MRYPPDYMIWKAKYNLSIRKNSGLKLYSVMSAFYNFDRFKEHP